MGVCQGSVAAELQGAGCHHSGGGEARRRHVIADGFRHQCRFEQPQPNAPMVFGYQQRADAEIAQAGSDAGAVVFAGGEFAHPIERILLTEEAAYVVDQQPLFFR